MILITGAGGLLGRYISEAFKDLPQKSLGLREESDFRYDLTKAVPDFGDIKFSTVIHTAGTEQDAHAMELNLEGTKRLLKGLEKNVPENFVFISSHRVYSRDAGDNITEEANAWASDAAGKSKALAEKEVIDWCQSHDVTLTVIRPALMFGNGVSGDMLQLFNDGVNGKYIHIRGNDAAVSVVLAYDVARAIRILYKKGGIYNAADGRNPKLIELVESMTANSGAKKRMTHLPPAWAEWIWRLGKWVPSINRNLSPEVVEKRMKSHTIDGSYMAQEAGISYYDTIAVMEGLDENYPYSYKTDNQSSTIEA